MAEPLVQHGRALGAALGLASYRPHCGLGQWDATDAKESPVVQLAAFHQQEATRPSAKPSNWRRAKKAPMSSTNYCAIPPPPSRTIGGQCRISREKRHCSPIWRLIWRRGSNSPKKMQVCVVEAIIWWKGILGSLDRSAASAADWTGRAGT